MVTSNLRLPKLIDATRAGKGTDYCTLIVTEGDSAKALAISSLTPQMKEVYGVYPLRGKVLNISGPFKQTQGQHRAQALVRGTWPQSQGQGDQFLQVASVPEAAGL